MTNARLEACPVCARHVRVVETACPFCSASLPAGFGSRAAPRAPSGRLGRAARYALGASTVALAAACSSGDTVPAYGAPAPPLDAGDEDVSFGVDAAYGAPPVDSGPADAASDAPHATPAYGAPAFDAGPADAASDAPLLVPLYGLAPFDAGGR